MISARQFEDLFEPSVRAFFNFDRMRAERWPISIVPVVSRHELAKVTLPWSPSDRPHGSRRRRYTIAAAARDLHGFSDDRRRSVMDAAGEISHAKSLPTVALPAAAERGGPTLLLDGSHRAVAAYLVGRVSLILVVVRVPASSWAVVD